MSALRLGLFVLGAIVLSILGVFVFLNWYEIPAPKRIEADVTKWMNGRRAAISITYDTGNPRDSSDVLKMAKKQGIPIDLEFVSGSINEDKLDYINNYLLPQGYQFFGHGHEHLNHDKLGADWAFNSAKKCFEKMDKLGMRPVAFAYPGGHGSRKATHEAIKRAGFLSARRHGIWSKPYILAGDRRRPSKWFGLTDVYMESIKYRHQKFAVNDTVDLKRFLRGALDRTAWIILTYHSIGLEDKFGFYEREHFITDLKEMKKGDFWIASMNDVTLYIYEREDIKVDAKRQDNRWGSPDYIKLRLEDGLPDARFNQPLTVRFSIPNAWISRKLSVTLDNREILSTRFSSAAALLNLKPIQKSYFIRPVTEPD